jgi:chemotaxis protein MotB
MPLRRLLVVLLMVAISAGCVKKSTHQKALAHIKDLEGQLSTAQSQIEDDDKRIKQLESDLATLQSGKQLSDEEKAKLQDEMNATEKELEDLRAKREADQKRLEAYQELQKRFKNLVATGALEVAFRNGQMTLKLPSGVLFPSGSADLSDDGKGTLAKVTAVLMEFKDRRFVIAGHTDNVPIKTKKFKNNWYLSSARAVSVLEYMIDQGFPASQLAAAGYADKDPVDPNADNNSEAAREQNRRIEIIIVPDLSELPQLSEEPQ